MKLTPMLVLVMVGSSLLAMPAFAQGKGGGGGGGGGPRGGGGGPSGVGQGPGVGHAPSSSRAAEPARPSEERRADRAENGAARRDADGLKPTGRSARSAAQELSSSMHEINQSAFAQRRELHQTLDMRLKSSREALKQIQSEAKDLRGAARDEFKASLDAVKARENELNDALKATRKSTEATWEKDRAALGHAYRNYSDAVSKLETLPRPPALPAPPAPTRLP